MDYEWILWIAVLVAWAMVGVIMAYLFREIARGGGEPEDSAFMPKVTQPRRWEWPWALRRIARLRDHR